MMKSNLEQQFKEAIESYEMPYNSKAWENLSSQLDKLPTAPKSPRNTGKNWKWIGGSAIAVIATSTLIYGILNKENGYQSEENTIVVTSEANDNTSTKQNNTVSTSTQKDQTANAIVSTENPTTSVNTSNQDQPQIIVNKSTNIPSSTTQTNSSTNNSSQKNGSNTTNASVTNNPNSTEITSVKEISNLPVNLLSELKDMCEGEATTVKNTNTFAVAIISPSGKELQVAANKSVIFTPTEAGIYTITAKNDARTIKVKETPLLDFTINEEIKYENGIPSIPLETYADATNFVWSFQGYSTKQYGNKCAAHFYKKGDFDITLTAKNTDGCTGSITKTVTIDENYNLLAPSGFMPKSDDPRKNRFIPIALTLRNTEFKMIIFEPRTGSIVFETTSTEGWDGMDRNTRQMVDENKSFAWKVILAHPEPGDRKSVV